MTVLLSCLDHVAIVTDDTDRLHTFSRDVFDVTDFGTELSVFFRDPDGTEAEVRRQGAMPGGRRHLGTPAVNSAGGGVR